MTVHAFWSYSREAEEFGGARLHKAMQSSLNEVMQDDVRIFRDTDAATGIAPGRKWVRSIVEALSGSILFFWVQSPRWLRRQICLFEYACFCDRVERLAAAFPTDSDLLRQHLIVPVRWADVDEAAGMEFPEDTPADVRQAWQGTQVSQALRMPQLSDGRYLGSSEYGQMCFGAAPGIRKAFSDGLKLLGVNYNEVHDFLARDRADFVQCWTEEFDWRIQSDQHRTHPLAGDLLRKQRKLARELTGGRIRRQLHHLNLDLALVPGGDGVAPFWATVAPLGGQTARDAADRLPPGLRPRTGSTGDRLWRADAAGLVEAMLRQSDLTLPDAAQAAMLRQLFSVPAADQRQLGWATGYANFWTRTPAGTLAGSATPGDELPLYFAQPVE